jgi:hypothetical protein
MKILKEGWYPGAVISKWRIGLTPHLQMNSSSRLLE